MVTHQYFFQNKSQLQHGKRPREPLEQLEPGASAGPDELAEQLLL